MKEQTKSPKELIISTGAFVGRVNNYDFNGFLKITPLLSISKFEFMVINAYESKYDEILDQIASLPNPISFPTLHMNKIIGELLCGGRDEVARALSIFKQNCQLAKKLGSTLLVLHLWGGEKSDSGFYKNLAILKTLQEISDEQNLILTVENVPCTERTPSERIEQILRHNPGTKITLDSRFCAFHGELFCPFWQKLIKSRQIAHIHISDFSGTPGNWHSFYPIVAPGQGISNFAEFFKFIEEYEGYINIESPVMGESGLDIKKMHSTTEYLKTFIN